jgi:peroxiredoxin
LGRHGILGSLANDARQRAKENAEVVYKSPFVALAVVTLLGAMWHLKDSRDQAPDVSFQTLDGQSLSLKAMRGQPVLVVFWATTCAVCIEELPALMTLYRELRPRGLQLVAVAMPYDPPNRVVAMAETRQIPYPVALDIRAEITRAFGDIRYTPSAILVGPEGHIEKRVIGRLDTTALRTDIEALLKSKV